MADVARLGIEVDSSGVPKADARLDKLTKAGGKAEKQTGKLTAAWKSFGTVLTTGAVVLGFRSILTATAKAQQSQAQLAAGLASTGGASGQTMESLSALADEIQRTTIFGDELVESAEAILLSFTNISGTAFPATIRAAADLSARMGTDLQSSIVQLGKALNEPVQNLSALSRSGIQFSKDQKTLIKSLWETGRVAEAQRIILAELERQYGGSAEAARETLGGAMTALSNAWGDFKESIGEGLAPALTPMFESLASFFGSIERWMTDTSSLMLHGWVEIKFGTLEAWEVLKVAWGSMTGAFEDAWHQFMSGVKSSLASFLDFTADTLQAMENGANLVGESFTLVASQVRGAAILARESSEAHVAQIGAQERATVDFVAAGRELERQRLEALDNLTESETQYFAAQRAGQTASVEGTRAMSDAWTDMVEDEATKQLRKEVEALGEETKKVASDMDKVWMSFTTGLVDSLLDADQRAKLTFESIASDFAKMVAKMLAQQAILRALGLGPAASATATVGAASGAAFSRGMQVAPFARGGVVSEPTLFPMANGAGLMGEAGPEAVMPLTRTSSGDLGVKAEGAGQRVSVTIVNHTGARATHERRRTEQGEDIVVTIGEAVNQHLASGGADGVLESEFGIRHRGRRR
jgi:phage-related minor tail protein